MKKRAVSIVIGILLIVVGIGYLGNVFNVWNFTIFFPGWWTMFLIIPAVLAMISSRPNVWNVFLLVLGLVLLVANLFNISIETLWFSLAAALLIFIGFALIIGKRGMPRGTFDAEPNNTEALKQFKLFSSSAVNITSQNFRGGKLTALFSDCVIDMRNIQPNHDILLDLGNTFSNVAIYAPENMHVVSNGCKVFLGSVSNAINYRAEGGEHILYITGSCTFANLDIF